MRASFPWIFALVLGCCVLGCGDDDDDSGEGNTSGTGNTTAGSGGSNSGGSGTGGGSSSDRCHDGCIATMAAKCSVGPKDQATCESDCHALEAGNCATEYKAFQDCAAGKPVICDAITSIPTVAACETQQATFIACAQK
jgi:hypothetical protein